MKTATAGAQQKGLHIHLKLGSRSMMTITRSVRSTGGGKPVETAVIGAVVLGFPSNRLKKEPDRLGPTSRMSRGAGPSFWNFNSIALFHSSRATGANAPFSLPC